MLHIEKQVEKVETKVLLATAIDKNETTTGEINVKTLIATSEESDFRDEDNLLATAMVNVYTKNGDKVVLRAVVDMGSQSPMITERAQQALGLETVTVNAGVDGVDALQTRTKKRTKLNIFSRFSNDYALHIKPLVMKNITNLRVFKDDLSKYEHLQNLKYADPSISSDQPIDLLLCVADYTRILKSGLIKNKQEEPVAQNTELGWLILGPDGAKAEIKAENETVTILISNTEMERKITNLFELSEIEDSIGHTNENLTEEEQFCEEYFTKTTKRDAEGRFIVSIPFKGNQEPKLGDSRKAALATLFSLEERFKRNAELKKLYTESINNAIEKGYLVKLDKPLANSFYIPHHPVFKNSATTKMRIVYNASQRTSNGMSLNEQLAIGKMTQATIFELLLRWRTYKIAVVADIEKMYLQIKLNEAQHHLQIILLRDEKTNKIIEVKMTTVTFGLANSPYLAVRWLKEVANTVAEKYPLASSAIDKNFYMDNHAGGATAVSDAKELCTQLRESFNTVGCNLREFASNSSELMSGIPENDRAQIVDDTMKMLGIRWNTKHDTLPIKIDFDLAAKAETKRQIIAEIAAVYDPLGIITPMIVKAKILIQHIWQISNQKKNYGWDEKLPAEIVEEWSDIKTKAIALNSMHVPRWIGTNNENNVQIHGFCDASQKAYAACVYIRACKNNSITTTLLVSKSKNAPVRQTIPKLELCGAKLLTQLVKKVCATLNTKIDEVHLWSDSTCVLGWVAANPLRYKKFVSTRISYIQTLKDAKWHHIAGKENPADCASRGVFGDELKGKKLWWNGPEILRECIDFNQETHTNYTTENELKTIKTNTLISVRNEGFIPQAESFYKLKKTFAFVLRFVHNCKDKNNKRTGQITVNEMRKATTTIIKMIQGECFDNERKLIASGKNLDKKSKLFKLNVFADSEGLIRVGGRLRNANIPFNAKHQIILPKHNEVTNLIIHETHRLALHAGPRLTEAILRRQYWVIDSQSTIKTELKKCFVCAKYAPRAMSQLMADLPEYRVNEPFKIFLNTAIDFAGPFFTKVSTLRNSKSEKSYICVFVCMASRAIHLELVGNLTADSCIAALRRFIGRRGKVARFFSDNGTNFVKANKILQELSEAEKEQYQDAVDDELLSNEIEWNFSPPGSPHHNGLAEAAVKSMKTHLKKALGEKVLTLEEIHTLVCQIEGVVNSRPMCSINDDPNDTQTITPAHFLQLVPMQLAPDEDVSDVKANYLSRWQLVQKIFQQFWKQWKSEYLNQLQVRHKWCTAKEEIDVNDLVMLKEDGLPATKWSLGRIIKKHPGKDGATRVVTVKTGGTEVTRTITKVAPLPMKNDGKSSGAKILTTLLGVLTLISSTKAHEFTLIDNDQVASSNQSVNLAIRHSEQYATYTVVAIFIVCFFAFLIFWLHILYRTLSTNSDSHDIEMRTVQQKPNMTITDEMNTQKEQQQTRSKNTYNPTQAEPSQREHHRLATPVPAIRKLGAVGEILPIVELEREYYSSRRESLTASLYPHMDLMELKKKIEQDHI